MSFPWNAGDILTAAALNSAVSTVVATGAPLPATLATVVADVMALRSYGFVGGGSGAALSSVYATLAAAQAVYPHAIALTDTLDWAAIQGLYNAVAATSANGVSILLPPGDVVINRPIVTGSKAVYIRGCGPFTTRIQCSAANDLFQHGLSVQNAFAAFELQSVGLYCTVAGTGFAINIRQGMSWGQFRLTDVRIASFSASFDWAGFVNAEGTTNSTFRDVQCSGGAYNAPANQPPMTQVGFTFNSPDNADKAFVITFDNCQIDSVVNAIQCNITGAPGNSGSLEGFIFKNCGGRTDTGAWLKVSIPSSAAAWAPPYYVFDKCNFEGPGTIIDIDACSEFHMANCLHYQDAFQTGATVRDFIRLGRVKQAFITSNTLVFYASAQSASVINVGANSQNVTVADNNIMVMDPSASLTGGVTIDASATGVSVRNNRYIGWPAGVAKEVGTTASLLAGGTNPIVLGNDRGTAIQTLDPGGTVANYATVQPSLTGLGPILGVSGSDTNAPLNLQPKGASPVQVLGAVSVQGSVTAGSALANKVALQGAASGSDVTVISTGTDANINITLTPQGSGYVRSSSPFRIPFYAVGSLPSVSTYNGCLIRVTGSATGKGFAISDGTNWRWADGAIVS